MVINLQDYCFGVSHELSDLLDADCRDLITEVGAIIMPEDMSRQFSDSEIFFVHFGQCIHDSFPHFCIAALGNVDISAAVKEIGAIDPFRIVFEVFGQKSRHRHATDAVFGLCAF